MNRALVLAAAFLVPAAAWAGPSQHRCAGHARDQAKALLAFHSGQAADAGVDDVVETLPPLRNPVDRRRLLDVLGVRGHVYRTDYRLKMIYARIPGRCVLMGQEILELSVP